MKAYIIPIIFAVSVSGTAHGIENSNSSKLKAKKESSNAYANYIGFNAGIKGTYGLVALTYSTMLKPNVYATIGGGLSAWRFKVAADVQHFSKPNRRGFAIGGGLAFARGGSSLQGEDPTSLATYYYTTKPLFIINGVIGYHFNLTDKTSFFIQSGVGIRLGKLADFSFPASIVEEDQNLIKTAVGLAAPSGINTCLGFNFALGNSN